MIKGIGIDIIELERIKGSLERNNRFVDRILTENEMNLFIRLQNHHRKVEFLAGRFAAKEAFSKAVGTGIGKLSFHDIEVLPDRNGAPTITAYGYEAYRSFISITHSREYAVAQVVIEGED
ncbi:holo-ACP synthase [Oceanobacillus chungangensis]|uniref:Holo-[acyl-carrier-protein] synthase n=1 Tax=Oceanobacillus chungangensis TaxID=1229152 RepID=A0A3D8PHX9_9BACI|nr:holo-ACP synthase [Oceanobacillus chungangensis]RDW15087.1 holo-ACP synthase [Oceanobacillus chungangensis]